MTVTGRSTKPEVCGCRLRAAVLPDANFPRLQDSSPWHCRRPHRRCPRRPHRRCPRRLHRRCPRRPHRPHCRKYFQEQRQRLLTQI